MVLVHDTSSQCALQMYDVSSKCLKGYQVVEQTRLTDKQTDRCEGKNNMSPNPEVGRHKTMSPDPEGGRHNYPAGKELRLT